MALVHETIQTHQQLNRILVRLQKFRRDKHDQADDDVDDSGSDGGTGNARGTTGRMPRYRGLPANNNPRRPPLIKKKLHPYEFCVSEEWPNKAGNTDVVIRENPEKFTIFSLNIPNSHFDEVDLEYLGDDENNDEQDGNMPSSAIPPSQNQ